MRIGIKPGQWGWRWSELTQAWRLVERSGFATLSCFDHLTSAPRALRAWDAGAVLLAMAALTRRVTLRVDVFNVCLRNPVTLASQTAVAQALSEGRVQVGLGAGSWHLARFDHRAVGLDFPQLADRVARLSAFCRVLPRLWRGEHVTEPSLALEDASLGPLELAAPGLVVGGSSRPVLEIAARYADGWNGVLKAMDTYRKTLGELTKVCGTVGRTRKLARTAQVYLADVGLDGIRPLLAQLAELQVDEVLFVLTQEKDPDVILRIADAARPHLG